MNALLYPAWIALLFVMAGCASGPGQSYVKNSNPVKSSQFIYESAPFPSCHASTLVETRDGMLASWFGGTAEGNPDVGIWVSQFRRGKWSVPVEVAHGVQSDGKRFPCWNPVLAQTKSGSTWLFYKVGPNPRQWWGMVMESSDQGRTWSKPRRLPDGILGPIKNKAVWLESGVLLCPSSTEHDGWRVHVEWTRDTARWERSEPLNDGKEFGAIQPAILLHPGGRLQMLCRSRQQFVTQSWSEDGGKRWSAMSKTTLPNPNSGIDAVTLKDGRHLLIYNNTPRGRTPLNLALSRDGVAWQDVLLLESEPGEYSYPAIVQARDGKVHLSYTWKRQKIRHVVIDPETLESR